MNRTLSLGCAWGAVLLIASPGCRRDEPAAPEPERLRVVRTVPWYGASGVPIDVPIQLVFQRDVKLDELPAGAFRINNVVASVQEVRGAMVTLRPPSPLEYNHRYTVTMISDAWSAVRTPPPDSYGWFFSTDPGPPGLTWSFDGGGTTSNLNSISSGFEGYYIAGDASTLLFSWQGGTWTHRAYTVPTGDLLRVYRRGGSLDLLIDASGGVHVSRNGVSRCGRFHPAGARCRIRLGAGRHPRRRQRHRDARAVRRHANPVHLAGVGAFFGRCRLGRW
jgi:hypothetical protein